MKEYVVGKDFVRFPVGSVLELTDVQASKRANRLEKVDEGMYKVVNKPVGFKLGEVIGCEPSKMPKGALEEYEPSTEASAPEAETDAASVEPEASEGEEAEATDTEEPPAAGEGDNMESEKSLDEVLDGFSDKELKTALDKKKVKYGKKPTRKALLKKLKKALEKEKAGA